MVLEAAPREMRGLWAPLAALLWRVTASPHGVSTEEACFDAFHARIDEFRELSAVMAEELQWDVLRRAGNPSVCLGEGHRFFFVLFFYSHWRTASTTADFGVCVPSGCNAITVQNELLPAMYDHFFMRHVDFKEDGSLDQDRSMKYGFTLKEYKRSMLILTDDLRRIVLAGLVVIGLPPLLASSLVEMRIAFRFFCGPSAVAAAEVSAQPEEAPAGRQRGPFDSMLRAFSMRHSWRALSQPGPNECADLCRLRAGLTATLLTLHVTQGSKWRLLDELERSHPLFLVVRPFALVNDGFVLLSAYLCSWSYARAEATDEGSSKRKSAVSLTFRGRLLRGLRRSAQKYVRQLPLCLLWAWVYLGLLPNVPYNLYNHTYPWFGVRWFQQTAKCMHYKLRYAFLMGDVAELLFLEHDKNWFSGNGNPCANLWNFQLEIEAFTAATCCLALPATLGSAVMAAVVATSVSSLLDGRDWWIVYHARGVGILLLFLRVLGLPHVGAPAGRWRIMRLPGTCLVLLACTVHGAVHGGWFKETLPALAAGLRSHTAAAILVYQAALAVGFGLICEACRAPQRPHNGQLSSHVTEAPAPWLCAASRLAFGINAAHPFVQWYVEAHASLEPRVFSIFSWVWQLFGVSALSSLMAAAAYVLVQRPWAWAFSTCLDAVFWPGDWLLAALTARTSATDEATDTRGKQRFGTGVRPRVGHADHA